MRCAYETLGVAAFGALALSVSAPALAGSAWDEIRAGVFGTRTIHPAGDLVALSAPTRPEDQRAVPIGGRGDLQGRAHGARRHAHRR